MRPLGLGRRCLRVQCCGGDGGSGRSGGGARRAARCAALPRALPHGRALWPCFLQQAVRSSLTGRAAPACLPACRASRAPPRAWWTPQSSAPTHSSTRPAPLSECGQAAGSCSSSSSAAAAAGPPGPCGWPGRPAARPPGPSRRRRMYVHSPLAPGMGAARTCALCPAHDHPSPGSQEGRPPLAASRPHDCPPVGATNKCRGLALDPLQSFRGS